MAKAATKRKATPKQLAHLARLNARQKGAGRARAELPTLPAVPVAEASSSSAAPAPAEESPADVGSLSEVQEAIRQATAAAREAIGAGPVKPSIGTTAAEAGSDPEAVPSMAGELSADDLQTMCGLVWWGFVKLLPARLGGGDLSEKERSMLGRSWSIALMPYLREKVSGIVLAVVMTAEVFAGRIMAARVREALEGPQLAAKPPAESGAPAE